ncbi:uncharacterized protein LOC134834657 [Culicoides brevitarsis]|uniref:uncharacterized protein LOC134834657 n=1 Tax=Culicoides brevitarsis TaxID=469753 RepID=UPI00307CAFA2
MNPETILKSYEKSLFGKDLELTQIQKLLAKTLFYKLRANYKKNDVEAKFVYDSNVIQCALEAEIDKETPNPDSPDYNKFLAMKAVSICHQSPLERAEKLPAAIAALEPIKFAPEVSLAYVVASIHMDCKKENLDYYLNAEAVYDHYKKNGTPCLSTHEIFGALPVIEQENDLIVQEFFDKFEKLKNDDLAIKYVMPSLKAFFNKAKIMEKMEYGKFKFEALIPEFRSHFQLLLKTHHFAQVDHLLAIFMFHLVKAGRAKPQTEESQNQIDAAKALVSSWYTMVGWTLAMCAEFMARNPEFALKYPVRTEVVRFEEFMEPGVEIYENQFPIDFIQTEKEWDGVINKGKVWSQRALDYFRKCGNSGKKFKDLVEGLETLLKLFKNWNEPILS